jgi:hypothetical protein
MLNGWEIDGSTYPVQRCVGAKRVFFCQAFSGAYSFIEGIKTRDIPTVD